MFKIKIQNRAGVEVDFGLRRDKHVDFKILTAFKDRVGHAPKGRGALLIIIWLWLWLWLWFWLWFWL